MSIEPIANQSYHSVMSSCHLESARFQRKQEAIGDGDQFSVKLGTVSNQDQSPSPSDRIDVVRDAIQSHSTRYAELSDEEKDAFAEMFAGMPTSSAGRLYSYGASEPARGSLINVQA